MVIKTVGSVESSLNAYNAKDWVKSAEFGFKTNFVSPELKLPQQNIEIAKGGKTFGDFLSDSIMKVNQLQGDANVAIQKLAVGETKNIHETMLAVEQANMAFKAMNKIRNKVIDAYKEIMRMQV